MAKKKKRRKRKIGIGLIGIEVLLAIIILVLLAGMGCYFLCPLKSITVEGTDLYTKEQISEYIVDGKFPDNAVYVFLDNLIFPKGSTEFVDHYEVTMTDLNTINIKVVEKTILGYMQDDATYIYFNYNGKIVEISPTYIDGYMRVDGEIVEEPVIGNTLSIGADKAGFLVACIKLVKKMDLMPIQIYYDEYGRMTLVYETYKICLGNNDYLEEKVERISYILPNIEGLYGTLHLENYNPNNTDIVFEEENAASE